MGLTFTESRDGQQRVTLQVQHRLSPWELACGWVYGAVVTEKVEGTVELPQSKAAVERANRWAWMDNPTGTIYVTDNVSNDHVSAVERRIRRLWGMNENG